MGCGRRGGYFERETINGSSVGIPVRPLRRPVRAGFGREPVPRLRSGLNLAIIPSNDGETRDKFSTYFIDTHFTEFYYFPQMI